MITRRGPSHPPDIPGFTPLSPIGSGGFADVFLYEQHMPRRRVAVKVLAHDVLDDGARRRFDVEANLMAGLSTHPAIATIHLADVAADGRPFLVMEYCPGGSLAQRYRRERLPVAEVLRIGIQVAGAVETAHRAGIVHRDIKPANVLLTEYGRPALTDFGISAMVGVLDDEDVSGISLPWSPPEVLTEESRGTPQSDVYSLTATLYTLLAGRPPFEVPGASHSAMALSARIAAAPVPPIGRDDVPASLERALATGMAKDPTGRFRTALALARALQQVQVGLAESVTPIDVIDPTALAPVAEGDAAGTTRIRPVMRVDGGGAPATAVEETPSARADHDLPMPAWPPAPNRGAGVPVSLEKTVRRSTAPTTPSDQPLEYPPEPVFGGWTDAAYVEAQRRRRRPVVLIAAAALVLSALGVGGWTLVRGLTSQPSSAAAGSGAGAAAAPTIGASAEASGEAAASSPPTPAELLAVRNIWQATTCAADDDDAATLVAYDAAAAASADPDHGEPAAEVAGGLGLLTRACGDIYASDVARRVSLASGVSAPVAAAAASVADAAVAFPPPADAVAARYLESPARNISCVLSEDGAGCSILERAYGTGDCPARFFSAVVSGGNASTACGTEWLSPPGASVYPLGYGQTATFANVACTVEEDGPRRGMTCWDIRTGNSFLVARARYEISNG